MQGDKKALIEESIHGTFWRFFIRKKINPFIGLYIAGKDHCIRHIFAIPTIHYIEEKGLLMNWTGDEKYDGLFPYHPLSEMRRFISYVVENN